jgi:hexosaminidase
MATQIVPEPVLVQPAAGVDFALTSGTVIDTQPGSAAATQIGDYLAGLLRPSTGFPLPVQAAAAGDDAAAGASTGADEISLLLSGAPASVGSQGYELDVTGGGVTIRAEQPAGLFAGVQTLRQLLPAKSAKSTGQSGPWPVPGGHIVDYPRYGYRGAMLDVARHFFGVADVERYIDEISLYKINYLHIHLSDDQGWRIAINGWPKLTSVGGATGVGESSGGYFTQAEFKSIVAYAQSRYITVIPEVDMPSHVDAALAAYPQLGCLATAPKAYTSIQGAGSTLCDSAATKQFITDVTGQLAALTPGPYLQIGGDEATTTPSATYSAVLVQAQADVAAAGKTPIGWDAVADAPLNPKTVLEYWHIPSQPASPNFFAAAQKGQPVIMAPADHAYLDQMYEPGQSLGLHWAGYVEVRNAYNWDPTTVAPGVPAASVLGVEAPLWTETLGTVGDLEFMAFPRLPAIAEIGWSPQSTHDWNAFSVRLAAQAPLWDALGMNYYKSIQVPWK